MTGYGIVIGLLVMLPLLTGLVVIPTLAFWTLTILLTRSLVLRFAIPSVTTGILLGSVLPYLFSSNVNRQSGVSDRLLAGAVGIAIALTFVAIFNKLASKKNDRHP